MNIKLFFLVVGFVGGLVLVRNFVKSIGWLDFLVLLFILGSLFGLVVFTVGVRHHG